MERKEFLKKGFLGTGIFLGTAGVSRLISNSIEELQPLQPMKKDFILGTNHLPLHTQQNMENTVLHKADTRGTADFGWLKSRHTFSFSSYYNPERMHFGALRVLNDDIVAPGMGFGTHPHDNMEIISIPLGGDLEHKDSMGNTAVIKNGDIQVMSAGTGIKHSEYNKSATEEVKFLQIWVFPNKNNVAPRYDQITLKQEDRINKWQQILSPNANDDGVWIHQNAWFYLGKFDALQKNEIHLKNKENGLYVFLLDGKIKINNQELNSRDGYGLWNTEQCSFEAIDKSEVLVMEVPMTI